MRFTAEIKDGKIKWHDERAIAEHLSLIDSEECYIDIKPSKVRNTAQNNYYWALLRDWGICIGHGQYDVDYLHGVIKSAFKIKTTTDYDKQEFSVFLDDVYIMCAKTDIMGKTPGLPNLSNFQLHVVDIVSYLLKTKFFHINIINF